MDPSRPDTLSRRRRSIDLRALGERDEAGLHDHLQKVRVRFLAKDPNVTRGEGPGERKYGKHARSAPRSQPPAATLSPPCGPGPSVFTAHAKRGTGRASVSRVSGRRGPRRSRQCRSGPTRAAWPFLGWTHVMPGARRWLRRNPAGNLRGALTAKAIDESLKLCHKIGPTAMPITEEVRA